MKKIKLLTPIFGLTALTGTLVPLTSCGSTAKAVKYLPENLLNIDGNILKGIKNGEDISSYTNLVIPSSVRIIETNAFNNVFTNSTAMNKITIPSTVHEIRSGAFAGCSSVSEYDLTNYTYHDVYELNILEGAFGQVEYEYYSYMKINQNLNDVQKETLINKLRGSGVPAFWLVEPTSGHIEITNATEQTSIGGAGIHKLELLGQYGDEFEYTAVVSRLDGSDGVGIETSGEVIRSKDPKEISVKTSMASIAGKTLETSDWVEYKLTIFCTSNDTIKWVQTVEPLKLTYEQPATF